MVSLLCSVDACLGVFVGTAAMATSGTGTLFPYTTLCRSDALSSIGSFIGVFGARLGFPILDPIASVVICIFILNAAIDIFKDAIDKMVDKSCDEETELKLKALIDAQDGVHGIDMLQTRLFGSRMYVDVEINVNKNLSVAEGHDIAEKVHSAIEQAFPNVKHCMVHVNPS